MKTIIVLFLGALAGYGMGRFNGDQATLRDCATQGHALMQGGGTVDCKVRLKS